MKVELTDREKLFLEKTDKIVDEWRKVLEFDPIWEISSDIISSQEDRFGAVDISEAEYYRADLLLCEDLFSYTEENFIHEVNNNIVPHELIHIMSVDFFRTALLLAGENEIFKKELRYRYEQFVVKFCKVITKLRNENLRLRYELEGKGSGAEE